ncbi:MAG: DUF3106 domain-containing protein [Rhizomicrobium sp.]
MRFSTLALATLILASPAAAFAQDQMGHGGMMSGQMMMGGMHGFFTPEQREMYMETNRIDFSSMTHDQRHAAMQSLHAKFDAMSDADKAKLKAEMQAKFDALTPDQKQAVEQKIAERHSHWHDHGGDRQ